MLTALRLALEDTLAPPQRRAIGISLGLAVLLLALLWLGLGLLVARTQVAGIWWLDTLIDLTGEIAVPVLAWMLFPALTMLILGFFSMASSPRWKAADIRGLWRSADAACSPGSPARCGCWGRRCCSIGWRCALSHSADKPLYLLPIEWLSYRARIF